MLLTVLGLHTQLCLLCEKSLSGILMYIFLGAYYTPIKRLFFKLFYLMTITALPYPCKQKEFVNWMYRSIFPFLNF